MKRAIRCLILMTLMMLFTLTAKAQETARLSVDAVIASSGKYADVSVSLNGNSGFAAYQMDIFYDSEYLQPIEVTGGLGGTPIYNMDATSGQRTCVKVAQARVMPIHGDGDLFYIRFQILNVPKGGISTTLKAENIRIYAGDGTEFALRIEDANIKLPYDLSEGEDAFDNVLQGEAVPSGPGEDSESTDDRPSVSETDTSSPQHSGSDIPDTDSSVSAADIVDNSADVSETDKGQSGNSEDMSESPESDLPVGLAENDKTEENGNVALIVIAAVLIAAAGGAAGFLLYRRHKTKEVPRNRE